MKWFMEAYNNRPQSGPQDFRPTMSIPVPTPMTTSLNSKWEWRNGGWTIHKAPDGTLFIRGVEPSWKCRRNYNNIVVAAGNARSPSWLVAKRLVYDLFCLLMWWRVRIPLSALEDATFQLSLNLISFWRPVSYSLQNLRNFCLIQLKV